MKSVSQNISAAILLLAIAITTTFAISCNKKDPCAECAEKNANDTTVVTTEVIENDEVYNDAATETNRISQSNTNSGTRKSSAGKNPEPVNSEDESNVSIIDPNQKSNTDSDRVYGSSGTSGGSGTSGSGGEGNGSSGWNANVKKK